jgi:REP element-mobilizing transposase RayT
MQRNFDFSTGEFYHVYNRGNDKKKVFNDDKDYLRFMVLLYTCNNINSIHLSNHSGLSKPQNLLKMFSLKREETLVDIGSYCLMPNHIHLLLKEKIEGGISLFLQKLFTAYSMYFNKKYKRTGKLFEGVYKAEHANTDNYLKYLYTYINLNPVSLIENDWKNKIVKDKKKAKEFLNGYKNSSYFDYIGIQREENNILNKEAFPEYFESELDFDSMINEWFNFINHGKV